VYFSDSKSGESAQQQCLRLATVADGPVALDWSNADAVNLSESDLERDATETNASFTPVPSPATQPKSYDAWSKLLADAMFRTLKMELLRSPALELSSKPGESERDFRVRLAQAAREQRDAEIERLRAKYAPKLATLAERLRRVQMAQQVQREQATASKWQVAMSVGASILGGLLGRKTISAANVGRAATAARGVGRTMKESADVTRAGENIAAVEQQIADLNAQVESEVSEIRSHYDAAGEQLERIPLRPKKTDIKVRLVALAWTPFWRTSSGETPAWE
jgi:hypothetical protein